MTQIESALPSLARPIMSLDGNEDAIVGALKQSLRQLENLGAQRAGLEDILKEMKIKVRKYLYLSSIAYLQNAHFKGKHRLDSCSVGISHLTNFIYLSLQDDILPKLMASTGSQEDLFKKEISKYDQICEEIAQNIEAQEQLLLQIQAQNDDFSSVFNLEDYNGIHSLLSFIGLLEFLNFFASVSFILS
ncbi:hypothetical protein B296_00022683 [Ensete ventricosum]|uniref:ALIX V-shaped domain-containing protein n=1 Tax=Ensete ventricosum TaxID=4639 RepID=A0A426ZNL6_ENSVE|nr:hypothetical protein B296_00022683 [Ensete ventricosum]